jgi:hypothetical protein
VCCRAIAAEFCLTTGFSVSNFVCLNFQFDRFIDQAIAQHP